jgi:hypothetical protein
VLNELEMYISSNTCAEMVQGFISRKTQFTMAIVIQEALDGDVPRACEIETAAYKPANLGAVCTYAYDQSG